MQCLIKHDKADVGSPLLEAAPVQVFDHSGDTVVVVANIPCCPSLDHLYFVFVCLHFLEEDLIALLPLIFSDLKIPLQSAVVVCGCITDY